MGFRDNGLPKGAGAHHRARGRARRDLRYVVFDQEATGVNPERDHIISIGAVAVVAGEIRLDDVFEAVIRVPILTSTVVVHGITPEESSRGVEEASAVAAFLDFLGQDVLVGHLVRFDLALLRAAAGRIGRSVPNAALDTMRITLGLFGAPSIESEGTESFELDALCRRFGIVPHDRHTAPGDAFLTAQIFVQLLRRCERSGVDVFRFAENV